MSASAAHLARVPAQFRKLVKEESLFGRHDKSPWSPSAKATARVCNPLPAPEVCTCGGAVVVAHHEHVYGRSYSEWPWMYRCQECGSSVGMHPFTSIPLGTLADSALKMARKECKQPFELIWRSRRMTRTQAYAELAAHLKIEVGACHFGWFDAATCARAKAWAVGVLNGGAA